jgi:hypothetical protein
MNLLSSWSTLDHQSPRPPAHLAPDLAKVINLVRCENKKLIQEKVQIASELT